MKIRYLIGTQVHIRSSDNKFKVTGELKQTIGENYIVGDANKYFCIFSDTDVEKITMHFEYNEITLK